MSSNDVQTLANSIIGTSILAMPYCFAKCGIILSMVLLILSTIITRKCCHYLIKTSIVTRRKNMELLGFYIFGNSGKTLVEISIIGFLMGTCIAFFVVIGDLCPLLFQKLFNVHNMNPDTLRKWLIVVVTIVCIIPLSFLKNIQSLSFMCKASIAFYIILTFKTILESFSRFKNDDHWATNIELWNTSNILQCLPIFSMAMSCQMQLFEVYENITSFDRIRSNIFHATSICLVVYTTIGFFGYVAFYNQTLSGNVLLSFTPSFSTDIITLGFILSIACSFPLVIFPCRSSLASLIYRKVHHSEISPYVPESKYKPLTIFIILSTMVVGIMIPSVEVIIGFVGSTIGTLICIIFPATCFVKIMQKNSNEKRVAQALIAVGFIVMILGTYSNLSALDEAKSGSHIEVSNLADKLPHLNDIQKLQNEAPPVLKKLDLAPPVKNLSEEVGIRKVVEVPDVKKIQEEAKISEDSIKKEEQEIAAEQKAVPKDPQQEIKEKDKEIKELKASKDKLEKEVLEMKQEIVKQNQETQKLVLQKFDEIAEKVDKIEKQSQDVVKEDEKVDELDKKGLREAENEKKASKEVENDVNQQAELSLDNKKEEPTLDSKKSADPALDNKKPEEPTLDNNKPEEPTLNSKKQKEPTLDNNKPLEPALDEKKPADKNLDQLQPATNETSNSAAEVKVNEQPIASRADIEPLDPIVKLIKDQEPLSYRVGEKMAVEKKQNLTLLANKKSVDELPVAKNKEKSSDLGKDANAAGNAEEIHDDMKNEMRKKRQTELDGILDVEAISAQLKSLISRDLKAVKDGDET